MALKYDKWTNKFYEEEEDPDEKIKLRKLIQRLEQQARKEYRNEHRKGYCPNCHSLLPLNGECWCGYTKK